MANLRKLGLASLVSMSLLGGEIDAREFRDYNCNNQSNSYFRENNYQNFRTDYDPNLSKPKVTDSLDLSGAIPLGVLTAGFLALLFIGSTSKNSVYRKK